MLSLSNDRLRYQLSTQMDATTASFQEAQIQSGILTRLKALESGDSTALAPMLQSKESGFGQTAIMVYKGGLSTQSLFKFKATQAINKIRETLIEKEQKKIAILEASETLKQRKIANVKKQVDRRRDELGVLPAYGQRTVTIKEVSEPAEPQPINYLQYFDLQNDFEDQDLLSVDLYMLNNAKLWNHLFN